jgi:hypothetical protein
VTRTDEFGNTYQRRVLESGEDYEVRKNFPARSAVESAVAAAGGEHVVVRELDYYWLSNHRVSSGLS